MARSWFKGSDRSSELDDLLEEERGSSSAARTSPRAPKFHSGDSDSQLMPRQVQAPQGRRAAAQGSVEGRLPRGCSGEYGIQPFEPAWHSRRKIEAPRVAMTRHIKSERTVGSTSSRTSRYESRHETRMGSGTGNPERWVARSCAPGRIMFE